MNNLLEMLANLLLFWPSGAIKSARENRRLKDVPFRKLPVLNAAKKEAASDKQGGTGRF